MKRMLEDGDHGKLLQSKLLKSKNLKNLKRTASSLISFLYGDELIIFRAAEALGIVCGELEKEDDEFVRGILRRLFWHLSDESGAYCRGAPIAIGEIGRTAIKAFDGFKNMTVSLLDNKEVELKYVIYAIGRAAESVRNAYPDPVEKLIQLLKHENAEIRGYSAWALGELKAEKAIKELEKLIGDEEEIILYTGFFKRVEIRDVVKEALEKIYSDSAVM